MNAHLKIVLLTVLLTIIYLYIKRSVARTLIYALSSFLDEKDYEGFDKKIDKKWIRLFLSSYIISNLKINEALLLENDELVKERLSQFQSGKYSDQEKASVYGNTYSYYLQKKDKEAAHYVLNYLKDLTDQKFYLEAKASFDIEFNRSTKYLAKYLNDLELSSGIEKASIASTISKIYQNMGDPINAQKYMKIAKAEYLKSVQ